MTNQTPPVKVAFIIDNEVVEILHTDERLSAIFLSNPVVKDVTGMLVENGGDVHLGAAYDPETDAYTRNGMIEITDPSTFPDVTDAVVAQVD